MQSGGYATHANNGYTNELAEVLGERDVSQGLWPALSPDLNPGEFYLCGKLKNKVYVNKPHLL